MFFLLFCLHIILSASLNIEDFTITVGCFNTEANPFSSKAPFFFSSLNEVSNSLIENSLILNFPKAQNPSYINFTTILIDDHIYNSTSPFVVDGGFFRIGVNGYKKRVKILDPSTHEPYIFNQFTITVSETFSKKDPMFLVKEMDSVPFQLGNNITFSFKLYISHFDNPPPEPDHLSLIVFICSIVTIISVIIFFFYFKSKGISITIIHLTDLWRIDLYFQNTTLLSSAGVNYIITLTVFLFFFYSNLPEDFYLFTNISILSNSISVMMFGWINFFMSRKLFLPEYVAIELTFNSFCTFPFIIVSIFNSRYFHSFVGIGLVKSILVPLACLFLSYLVSVSFYEFSQYYFQKKLVICPREERHKYSLLSLIPSVKELIRFLILGISFFIILKPVVDHCFLCFIDDYYFNPSLVASFILLYVSIISLISLFNGYKSINSFNNAWQTNHMSLNITISFFFSLYLIVEILFIRNYLFSFETLIYCAAFLSCIIPAIMLIGMAPSFYTKFFFFGFIYQSSDRNENCENN